jgi:deoxyribonuclease V
MRPLLTHPWPADEAEGAALQAAWAPRVERADRLGPVRLVAGVDVAYDEHSDEVVAAVAVLDAATLAVVESAAARGHVYFPYLPGLFSFRELPPLIEALAALKCTPDLIVCDGQGLAHPRRFGLACHLGVLFDVPTIGCGKTPLLGPGMTAAEPAASRGAIAALTDGGETVGCTLRTRDGVKPLYVSIGHRISLPTACEWILRLSPKYRLPETTRQADQLVRRSRREDARQKS